ncbi:uncharacterized protein LOC144602728 [Rhinoraja longicauda]
MASPDPYKHRAVLFPGNASLLLRDLQINDSGIYELSISHSTGTEGGSFNLTVQSDGTSKEQAAAVGTKVRYVGLVIFFIFFCLIVKAHGGCKRTQAQREKQRDRSGQHGGKNLPTSNPTEPQAEMKTLEPTGSDEKTQDDQKQIGRN